MVVNNDDLVALALMCHLLDQIQLIAAAVLIVAQISDGQGVIVNDGLGTVTEAQLGIVHGSDLAGSQLQSLQCRLLCNALQADVAQINNTVVIELVHDLLGNIGLKGVAQESALKTLELTAGKVATMYDSELGFRHGPKSIIDDNTLTVAYLSDDEYRRRYELDLVKEMAHQRKGNKIAVVYNHDCEGIEELADYPIQIKVGADMENVLLGLDFILFAQTIALMKSLSLGITPDNPCPTGEVNRVVKGVTLYPYTLK